MGAVPNASNSGDSPRAIRRVLEEERSSNQIHCKEKVQLEMESSRKRDSVEEAIGGPRKRAAMIPYPGAAIEPRLSRNDAKRFLGRVKEYFKDDKPKYNEFVQLLKDFKADPERLDTLDVIACAKELFQGDRQMLLHLNTMLPSGYEILVQSLELSQFSKLFINKLRARGETEYLKPVVHILHMYRYAGWTRDEIYRKATAVFSEDPDLFEELAFFLGEDPAGSTIPSTFPTSHPVVEPAHQPPQQPRQQHSLSVVGEKNTSSVSLPNQVVESRMEVGESDSDSE